MDFVSFCLTTHNSKQLFESQYSLLFNNQDVQLSYLSILHAIFAKSGIQAVDVVQLQQGEYDTLASMLSMTFLGQKKIYLFHGLSVLQPAEQAKYLQCFKTTKSEHIIFLATTKEYGYGKKIIVQPTLVRHEIMSLASIVTGKEEKYFVCFFDALENKGVKVTPEEFNLVLSYSNLVGRKTPDFFTNWMPRIFSSQKSLFQLSQAFFAKDLENFLRLWLVMNEQYSIAFWSTFFSDQLFRAALIIMARKGKKMISQEVEKRLPFSFLKNDWQLHDVDKLIILHQTICDFDIAFKSGEVREEQLELLVFQYMEIE